MRSLSAPSRRHPDGNGNCSTGRRLSLVDGSTHQRQARSLPQRNPAEITLAVKPALQGEETVAEQQAIAVRQAIAALARPTANSDSTSASIGLRVKWNCFPSLLPQGAANHLAVRRATSPGVARYVACVIQILREAAILTMTSLGFRRHSLLGCNYRCDSVASLHERNCRDTKVRRRSIRGELYFRHGFGGAANVAKSRRADFSPCRMFLEIATFAKSCSPSFLRI